MSENVDIVLDRLRRARIAEDRAVDYLRAGAVVADGERVSDPETPHLRRPGSCYCPPNGGALIGGTGVSTRQPGQPRPKV